MWVPVPPGFIDAISVIVSLDRGCREQDLVVVSASINESNVVIYTLSITLSRLRGKMA